MKIGEESSQDVKDQIKDFLRDGVNPLRIAIEADVNRQDLLAWLFGGGYLPPDSLERLENWCKTEREAQSAQTLGFLDNPGYVETPTAQKIIDALDYARYAPAIAVIFGGAGVGKTTTLTHYAKTQPRTWVVTAAQARRTTSSILMELVETPSLRGFAYRTDSLFREALAMMRKTEFDSVNGLLIVDEAQHLETPAFDAIRAFYDEAGIGIAYVGNEEVYSRIRGKKRSGLSQVYSRVGRRLRIGEPTPEDVDAILESHGITGREERKYCQIIGTTPGGLRSLNNVILYAKLVVRGSRSPIGVDVLKEAASECGVFG